MTDGSVLSVVRHIVLDTMESRGSPRLAPPADAVAGWDSYTLVEIIFAIEDRFGFEMTSAEMEHIAAIEDLVAIVRAHRPDLAA